MHLLVFFSLQLASLWIVFVQPHNLRRALRALVLPSPSGGRRGRLPSGGA